MVINNAKKNDSKVVEHSLMSPLRYPGGKAGLSHFLQDMIRLNGLSGCDYYEPFAGGAGAALRLIADGCVQKIILNDADPCIYAFWVSVLTETERFVDRIRTVPLTINEWHKQQEVHHNPSSYSTFAIGFSSFYLNRCNRSGILKGAGPIGGSKQEGDWKLSARFNRETLIKRIQIIGEHKDAIYISNYDAIDFLKKTLPRGSGRKNVLVYADPPYVEAGKRLYYNSYKRADHELLANYLLQQRFLKCVISYDNTEFIRGLYSQYRQLLFSLRYSLQKKGKGFELLITPRHLKVPKSICIGGNSILFKSLSN
ncbi:MAG: DNA adenine methylase [Nitrospirae bacterium]|nr:DNA adenine methylase [Nitrospirota bacterium]MCL5977702.1 DNA adenine methylase [Nitrospirota bacterium]